MPGDLDNSEMREHAVVMKASHQRIGAAGSIVVRAHTLRCEARAKVYCPVDTGYLKNSIGSSFEGDGRFGEMTGTVTAGAKYARYVEYGTSRMGAQPYMTPAFEATQPEFVQACAQLGVRYAAGGR